MMRFLRAFSEALRLTLRGETPAPAHYRPLAEWSAAGLRKLDTARAAAEADGLDLTQIALKLDGRPTSLEQTLQMLRHNLVDEYPRLMRLDDPYSMLVVQSSNMNDQYRLSQFLAQDAVQSKALRRALQELEAHLRELPAIERPG